MKSAKLKCVTEAIDQLRKTADMDPSFQLARCWLGAGLCREENGPGTGG